MERWYIFSITLSCIKVVNYLFRPICIWLMVLMVDWIGSYYRLLPTRFCSSINWLNYAIGGVHSSGYSRLVLQLRSQFLWQNVPFICGFKTMCTLVPISRNNIRKTAPWCACVLEVSGLCLHVETNVANCRVISYMYV